jgi:enoyl-CoA hydratase
MADVFVDTMGDIATVTLSHPGKLNAIDVGMWRALAGAFAAFAQDESLRCVIVRGAKGNFAAGADIEEFATVRSTMAQGLAYHTDIIAGALDAIADCPHPTVAAIEGVCVGGGLEIACACDLRIAARNTRFGIPINRLGFPLAPGEMKHLLQLVGRATTLEILLEGRVFDAESALQKRLVHRIVDDAQTDAQATAKRIAAGAPSAARMNKFLARRLAPEPDALTPQELEAAFSFLESEDYREGVESFLEKRTPRFTGR